jgi:hypothetical protein
MDLLLRQIDLHFGIVDRVLHPEPNERLSSINKILGWRNTFVNTKLENEIKTYIATQQDVTGHNLLQLVFLTNLVDGPIVLGIKGMGYGLFADKTYYPKEVITTYHGILHETPVGGAYAIDVKRKDVKRKGRFKDEIWTIDGEYGFNLGSKGRWVNEKILPNGDFYQNIDLKWDNKKIEASFIPFGVTIQTGEQFYWYYGTEYDRSGYF